jgi:ferredoxin
MRHVVTQPIDCGSCATVCPDGVIVPSGPLSDAPGHHAPFRDRRREAIVEAFSRFTVLPERRTQTASTDLTVILIQQSVDEALYVGTAPDTEPDAPSGPTAERGRTH